MRRLPVQLLSLPPVIFALRALPGPRCADRPDGLVGVVPLPALGLSLLIVQNARADNAAGWPPWLVDGVSGGQG